MIINFNNLGGGGGTPSPSSSNYRVVDALSAITNPTEGLMAYVKAKTKVTNGVRIEISNWENFPKREDGRAESFLARVHWGDWDKNEYSEFGEDLLATNIYLSGNQFHWGWNNDGNLNYMESERDGAYYKIMYRTHNGEDSGYGSYFDFYPIDETPWGDYKFAIWDNCSTAVTQLTEIIPGRTYVYSAGQWVEIASTTFVWDNIAPSTTAETAALLEKIRASVARGIYPSILYQNHICNYSGGNSQWVNFEGVFGYNRNVVFYISDQIFDENGFNSVGIRLEDKQFLYDYNLPVASANELGGVKIGQGISIDQYGVISAQGGKNDIVLDIDELYNMSYADREVLWDEVYEKILAGHKIYAKGEIGGELGNYAYLPLEKYKAETDTSLNIGGFLYFAVKDANANIYLHFEFTSGGNLSGLEHNRLAKYDIYSLPKARSNTLGGVKIGSGISIDEDGVISVQGGGAEVVLLNKLTEQERLDLYSAITACYDYGTESFTSAWTEDKYAFFIDLRDRADRDEYGLNDTFEGFFPMQVARCHPTDYNIGGVFFSGVAGSRYGEGQIINIRFVIISDGSIDKGMWINKPNEAPTDLGIRIDSGGTINTNLSPGLNALSSLNSFGRIRFVYHGDSPIVGDGALLSFHRKNEQIDGQDKLVQYISGLCNVEGIVYKGTWHFIEYDYGETIAPDTWAAFS